MRLLTAISDHRVRLDGHLYAVTPPTVRTALTLLALAKPAAEGDREALQAFCEAARRWLPLGAYWRLFPPRWMPWRASATALSINYVTRIAALGGADKEEDSARDPETGDKVDPEEAMRLFLETPWHIHVAEVSRQLSMTPDQVMGMPWPLFQLMLRASDALRARYQLDLMSARGIPYIEKDHERDKAYTALQTRAGYTREKTREERRKEQRSVFEQLRKSMTSTS